MVNDATGVCNPEPLVGETYQKPVYPLPRPLTRTEQLAQEAREKRRRRALRNRKAFL